MEDQKNESGEELIDETGRNATQQRMDAEGVEDRPVGVEDAEQRQLKAAVAAAAADPTPEPAPEPENTGLMGRVRRLLGRG
jgi:hypothetical protein